MKTQQELNQKRLILAERAKRVLADPNKTAGQKAAAKWALDAISSRRTPVTKA